MKVKYYYLGWLIRAKRNTTLFHKGDMSWELYV